MKNLLKLLFVSSLIVPYLSRANDEASNSRKLQMIIAAETNSNYREGYLLAASLASKMYNEAQVDKVISVIETRLKPIKREVTVDRSQNIAGGINLFNIIKLKFGAHNDSTKLLTLNPEQIEKNKLKVELELRQLQTDVLNYVNAHSEELVMLKVFSIKALQFANELTKNGLEISPEEIDNISVKAQNLRFFGEQDFTTCILTKYPDVLQGISLNLIVSFIGSLNFAYTDQQNAHKEKVCQATTNQIEINEHNRDLIYVANFNELDRVLSKWIDLLKAETNLTFHSQKQFLSWGNPYYPQR